MVQNAESRSATDLLSMVTHPSGPIDVKNLSEDEINSMLEAARPYGGRRRDGYLMALQRGWWVNILYTAGIQALEIPEVLENVDPGLLLEQGHYVANHILRLVSGNVSRLSQARADWSVIPNTPDQIDQDGAKYAQHLLDYAYDHLDLETERTMLGLWLDVCGTCFVYAGWDQSKGVKRRVYFDPMTQKPLVSQQLMPQQRQWLDQVGSYTDAKDGDWDFEVLNPFQVIIPPRFTKLDKMPWILVRRSMSVDECWNRWPDKAKDLGPEDMSYTLAGHFWGRLPVLAHRPGLGLAGHSDNDDAVIVDELWYPPSERVPSGIWAVASKRHIFDYGPHPFAAQDIDTKYPLIDFHNLHLPGRFHSMSTVEHLIGPQRDYNRGRQQTIQQRDVLSTPQWLAPEGAIKRKITRNEYGDFIEYNPRIGKPELQNPPTLGDATVVSVAAAKDDMQMIAAFSDASLGQMPQGARSGNAVLALQERDQLSIGLTVKNMEHSFQRLGTQLLMMAWRFMRLPRAVAIYGESRQSDIRYFKGQDLNGNVHVRIRPGSMMPKSQSQTVELITSMMQMGLLNPLDPREKRMAIEAIRVGGWEKLFFQEDAARRRARIENLMFSKPEPRPDFAFPDVSVFDDHQAHWEEHLAFTYTDEYELLDPLRKMYFQAHMQKHLMAVGQAIEAAMSLQQVGGGGGSPQPAPVGQASQPRQRNETPGSMQREQQ